MSNNKILKLQVDNLKGSTLFRSYGRFIVRKPWLVIGVSLILMTLAVVGALTVGAETGNVLDDNTPEYKSYQEYEEKFGGGMRLFIVVEAREIIRTDIMTDLQDLETSLMEEKGVTDVFCITTVIRAAMKEAYGVEMLPSNDTALQMLILSLPSESSSIFLPDDNHTIMVVEMNHKMIGGLGGIRKRVEDAKFPDGTNLKLVGESVYYDELVVQIQDDMTLTLGVAVGLMIVILGLIFSNVKLRFLPLGMVLTGVLWTFGLMGLFDWSINLAVFAVFPILIGLGIDYSINIQNRAQEENERSDPKEAITKTLEKMVPTVGIALIATCLGFSSLLLSKMPMIRSFGLMCVVGVVLCFIAAVSLLPAILYLYHRWRSKKGSGDNSESRTKPRKKRDRLEKIFRGVSSWTAKHPTPVIMLAFILAIGGFVSSFWVDAVVDFEDLGGSDMQSKKDLDQLRLMIGGTDELIILVEGDDLARVDVFEWMQETGNLAIEKSHWVTSITSIATTVSMANNGSLPANDTLLKGMLQMLPGKALEGYITKDRTVAAIKITVLHVDNNEKEDLYDILKETFTDAPEGVTISVTGMPFVLMKASEALSNDSFFLTIAGCCLTFLGLLVIYRRLTKALVPIIPIVFVVGWSLGMMFLFHISLNPLTACLGALVIGLGAEFTILIMERYQEERENGLKPNESIKVATSRVGRAIFSSGLTTMGGFGALMASSFPFMREFGLVIVLDVILCLLSAVVVLPALIILMDRWLIKKNEML